tara:strand:+ start:203 stop:316 length:114 start_codon:yes stop_codon:yes gene_type:complete
MIPKIIAQAPNINVGIPVDDPTNIEIIAALNDTIPYQ